MLEVVATTFVDMFTTATILYLLLGVSIGLVIGVLPALGTTAGMALLVPFVYGMDMMAGVAMMTGLLAVVATGDTVMSVLVGIPGGGSSQATVLDGFPMAKKGEAARALSTAYFCSAIGGVFGALILTGAIFAARPIVLAFGTGELLMLALLGITMVSVLSGASLVKGFIACGLGMVLGAVGAAPTSGEFRMIGSVYYLIDGIPLAVVGLAIFAVPEVVDLLRRGQAISDRPVMGSGWLQGILDAWHNKWLVLRCSVIGVIIGALPIGGADWIAYGHAVQTCKPRDQFGKGDVRGVIAPESANNANAGGALVPTLIFGIPGSGSTAVFLGGLILLGIQPGPGMVDENLNVTYTIIWSLAVANILGASICFLASNQMAKLTAIRFAYLAPFLITVVFFGAFQSTRQWGDIVALFLLGLFAVYLRRFGFPRPALLIGFVLQHYIEVLLTQTLQIYTFETLFSRPLMWVLIAINLLSLYFGIKSRPNVQTEGTTGEVTRADIAPQVIFFLLITAFMLYCLYDVYDGMFRTKTFPMTIATVTLLFLVAGMVMMLRAKAADPILFDSEIGWRKREEGYQVNLLHYVLWISGFMLGIYLIGFIAAIAVFFLVFLRVKTDAGYLRIAIMAACAIGVLAAFSHFVVVDFPSGLLQAYVALPWPFN